MRGNGGPDDDTGVRRGYVEVDGVVLRQEGLDLLCRVGEKEFWVTGGEVFNTKPDGAGRGKIVIPLWLARHQKLL